MSLLRVKMAHSIKTIFPVAAISLALLAGCSTQTVEPPALLISRIEAPKPTAVNPNRPARPAESLIQSVELRFDADKTTLKDTDRALLDEARRAPDGRALASVIVTAQANESGTTARRQKIAEARARAIFNYFAMVGVPIDAIGIQNNLDEPWVAPSACRAKPPSEKIDMTTCLRPKSAAQIKVSFRDRD